MRGVITWIRRSVCQLSTTLGIFCFVEITFQLVEGTNPNYQFSWGHYNETLAVFGVLLLAIGYVTWKRSVPVDPPAPGENQPKAPNPSKTRRR